MFTLPFEEHPGVKFGFPFLNTHDAKFRSRNVSPVDGWSQLLQQQYKFTAAWTKISIHTSNTKMFKYNTVGVPLHKAVWVWRHPEIRRVKPGEFLSQSEKDKAASSNKAVILLWYTTALRVLVHRYCRTCTGPDNKWQKLGLFARARQR